MAKGDANKAQNQIDFQGGTSQNNINNLWGQNTDRTTQFQNLFGNAVQQNQGDYNNVSSAYDNFLKSMPSSGSLYSQFLGPKYAGATQAGPSVTPASDHPVDQLLAKYGAKDTGPGSGVTDASYWKQKYDSTGDQYYLDRLENDLKGSGMDAYGPSTKAGPIGSAISGYQNFADTGGFSPDDIAAIRARSVAPIRAIADNANREIQRQAALHPGVANTTAALAKSARDTAYATGDTATNAEAAIAQMKQQGRLYGLGGLASTGLSDQSNTTANRGLDLNAIEGASGNQLAGLGGKTNLYGTTPGLTNMFGNQVLQSGAQGINVGGLQNQLASMIINGQLGKSQIPGNFQSGLGNLASIFGLAGGLVDPITNLFKSNDNNAPYGPGY